MPISLSSKSILILAALLLSAGCEASCWPDVVEQEARVHMSYERLYYDASRAQLEREMLREELRKCPNSTDLYYALPPEHIASGTYSLLDMAVVADDPELTRKFARRARHDAPPDSSDLIYAGEYVALATFFEAEMALDELLRSGMSATETASSDWDTPLYSTQVYTEVGLRIIRRLVDEGANVNTANANGHTAIEAAAWQGDLMKVQCLYALGAPLPAPVDMEKLSSLSAYEAVQETDSFIRSQEKRLLPQVSAICNP